MSEPDDYYVDESEHLEQPGFQDDQEPVPVADITGHGGLWATRANQSEAQRRHAEILFRGLLFAATGGHADAAPVRIAALMLALGFYRDAEEACEATGSDRGAVYKAMRKLRWHLEE